MYAKSTMFVTLVLGVCVTASESQCPPKTPLSKLARNIDLESNANCQLETSAPSRTSGRLPEGDNSDTALALGLGAFGGGALAIWLAEGGLGALLGFGALGAIIGLAVCGGLML